MGGWVRDCLLWDKQQEDHKSQMEETEIYKILKFGVDQAYIERDTAIPHRLNCVIRPSDLTEGDLSYNIGYF